MEDVRMAGRKTTVALFVMWVLSRHLAAQLPEGSPSAFERKDDLDAFLADARAYEIKLETEPAVTLQLVPRPVMNWVGSAFVWLDRGRPEVIGTVWKSRGTRTRPAVWKHSFHSLSEHPITARFDGQLVWSPRRAGVTFRPVEGVAAPAETPWRRLAQMRELAHDFSVTGVYPRYESPRRTLRMLSQPVYRYASPERVLDGAIFVYTADIEVIDPDAVLLLEARPHDVGWRWEYAFARFHYVELTGYHREKEVWRVEDEALLMNQNRFGAGPGRDGVYYSVARP